MKSLIFTIPDWFTCEYDPSFISMPPRLSDSREDRQIQYEARVNIASLSIKRKILSKKYDMVNLVVKEIETFYIDNQLSEELGYHITKNICSTYRIHNSM